MLAFCLFVCLIKERQISSSKEASNLTATVSLHTQEEHEQDSTNNPTTSPHRKVRVSTPRRQLSTAGNKCRWPQLITSLQKGVWMGRYLLWGCGRCVQKEQDEQHEKGTAQESGASSTPSPLPPFSQVDRLKCTQTKHNLYFF